MEFASIYALPRAPPPNDDISSIGGNVDAGHKEVLANILGWKVRLGSAVFGNGAAYQLKLTEANLWEKPMGQGSDATATEASVVGELEVVDGELSCC